MNELQISLTGKIKDTNFDEWKSELIKQIASSKRDLKTDDDFALAESDVKTLKAGENSLKAAKASALDQAAEIQKLFDAIDEVSEEARQARLSLQNQIKKRKEEIRDEIVDNGMQQIASHISEQKDPFQAVNQNQFMNHAALEEFTKGKRSAASMQKAINKAVAEVKQIIDEKAKEISRNSDTLSAIDAKYTSLFQDENALLAMTSANLESTISERIEYYVEEQKRLAETKAIEPTQPETTETAVESTASPVATDHSPTALAGHFIISIEVFADKADATEFLDELEGRFIDREMVGEIKLTAC